MNQSDAQARAVVPTDRTRPALTGLPAEPADGTHAETQALRERVASLNKQLRARPAVSYAQGLLVGRYGVPGPQEAFALLREVSQRHNIKLHQVAAALITSTAPAPGAPQWFPGRVRTPVPPLRVLAPHTLDARNQAAVLKAALHRVLEVAQAQAGNVQLVEAGLLRLARHHGHSALFTDYFAFVEDGTLCAQAAADGQQRTVGDIAAAHDVFPDETRQFLWDTGSRAVHSVPLIGTDNIARGVISAHYHHRLKDGLDRTRLDTLRQLQQQMGAYLQWHHHNVVLDALEDLHHGAGGRLPERDRGREPWRGD
ncbi:ANTAR domain-containing protein [Streptomyces sp. NPDC016845]|uniref:ANTAR domain-containing protein n=1 Tax=Streptomyces sp. NPDC016845 TaxID=3364972 RepID=UPI0037B8B7D9